MTHNGTITMPRTMLASEWVVIMIKILKFHIFIAGEGSHLTVSSLIKDKAKRRREEQQI